MKNKTLMSFMIAGACIAGVSNAEAGHRGHEAAHIVGATGGLLHGVADLVGAITGQPRVVAPVVAPAPVVAAPVVATPAVAAPVVTPAPIVTPAPVVTPAVVPAVAPAPVVAPAVVTPAVVPAMVPVRRFRYRGRWY